MVSNFGCQYYAAMQLISIPQASLVLALFCQQAHAFCFVEAGKTYGVDPTLLKAIAKVESSWRADALNKNSNSVDIGVMQINSSWLTKEPFKGLGYRKEHLFEPCTNVMVGAWVLASNFKSYGYSWEAVGAYNASCRNVNEMVCMRVRNAYAWKVYRAYIEILKS